MVTSSYWIFRLNLISTADGLVPNGARPSAGTVRTEKFDIFFPNLSGYQWFCITINSLRPSDTHIYISVNYPSLVQIMACRLAGAKPLSEQMLVYCQLDYREQTSMASQLKFTYFHIKNAFENVGRKSILSRGGDELKIRRCHPKWLTRSKKTLVPFSVNLSSWCNLFS